LLQRAAVRAAVAVREQSQVASAELSVESICQEIARIAFFDIRRLYYPAGHEQAHQPIPMHLLDEGSARCVETYSLRGTARSSAGAREGGCVFKVKLWDRGERSRCC
jgi:hypothetical protein